MNAESIDTARASLEPTGADRRPTPRDRRPRDPRAAAPSLAGLYLREAHAEIRRAVRMPEFAVPTLLLPVLFYVLFGIVLARPGSGTAGYLLATYGVFAALGPALFGFGASVGYEREQGVLALKQISPLPVGAYLFAKLAVTLAFTAVVLVALYALAAGAGGVALPRAAWVQLFAVHLACVVPFGLLGLGIGLRLQGGAAVAVSNVLFMLLAVLGGLWFPVYVFPGVLRDVAGVLPSYHLAELALAVTGRNDGAGAPHHVAVVLAFAVLCGAHAAWAWRRVHR